MKVAISGAGIAGGTLAYWLKRAGHEPLLIEKAPALRTGGYVMDFWGVGYTIAERMGILPAVREAGYDVQEIRFVDDDGDKRGGYRQLKQRKSEWSFQRSSNGCEVENKDALPYVDKPLINLTSGKNNETT